MTRGKDELPVLIPFRDGHQEVLALAKLTDEGMSLRFKNKEDAQHLLDMNEEGRLLSLSFTYMAVPAAPGIRKEVL